MLINCKDLFDDPDNLKWEEAFISDRQAITITKKRISVYSSNYYYRDCKFKDIKEAIKRLETEHKMLKGAYAKWKKEFK